MPSIDPERLLHMSQEELDELYRSSSPGAIPTGDAQGLALLLPGTAVGRLATRLAFLLFWQGKVFNPENGDLKNKVSPFGIRAIRAKVYEGDSWMDGRPTIVLDYSQTSFVAQKIRDEIREVAPDLYLGKVWWGKRRLLDFTLNFRSKS